MAPRLSGQTSLVGGCGFLYSRLVWELKDIKNFSTKLHKFDPETEPCHNIVISKVAY